MVLWDPSNCPTRIAITEIIIKMYLFQERANGSLVNHDDVIKSKHFPPFVRGIQRSSMDSPHKGQWHGALMFSLICVWINGWVNSREAGDLRRYRTHCDVTVMVDRHANIAHRVNALCSRVDSKDFWRLQKQGQLTWSTVMSSRKEHEMWVFDAFPVVILDILLSKESNWWWLGTLRRLHVHARDLKHVNEWLLRWNRCYEVFDPIMT